MLPEMKDTTPMQERHEERPTVTLLGLNDFHRLSITRLLADRFTVTTHLEFSPRIAIVNAGLGPTLAMAEVSELLRLHPTTYIILFNSAFGWSPADILNCFRYGVSAYLMHPMRGEMLIKTMELALLDQLVMPNEAMGGFKENREAAPVLSNREIDVLRQVSKGASNKSMALALCMCEATVKVHMKSILRKLRLKNRTQAAVWGIKFLSTLESKTPSPVKETALAP